MTKFIINSKNLLTIPPKVAILRIHNLNKEYDMVLTVGAKELYERVKAECEADPKHTRTRYETGRGDERDREYILTPNGSYIFYFSVMHDNNWKQVLRGESTEYVMSVDVA